MGRGARAAVHGWTLWRGTPRDPVARTGFAAAALVWVTTALLFGPTAPDAESSVVFWLEAWLLLPFAVFWAFQTRESWHEGLPRDAVRGS